MGWDRASEIAMRKDETSMRIMDDPTARVLKLINRRVPAENEAALHLLGQQINISKTKLEGRIPEAICGNGSTYGYRGYSWSAGVYTNLRL